MSKNDKKEIAVMVVMCLFFYFTGKGVCVYFHQCPKPTIPRVQQLLIDEGYDLGESGADGVCGEKTEIAWTEWSQAMIEHENYLKCK